MICRLLLAGILACPVCEGDLGRRVREGIVTDGVGLNLVATVAPFAVVAIVVAAVHFGGCTVSKGGGRDDQ